MTHIFKIVPFILAFFGIVWLIQRFGNRDILVVFLSCSITVPVVYLIVDRFVQKNKLLHMKEQALRAEVALLKNQINPHFFFNTLNNLYGLAAEKSDEAPRMIQVLSELMRFTIYEGKKDHVPLRDEIAYLDNYLTLQRIRAREVDIRFTGDVADETMPVPPLLFIMLVENAFKHGVGSLTRGAFVHMNVTATTDHIEFSVENNVAPDAPRTAPGIGLQNLERRLALLFPDRHQLTARAEDGVYRAQLRLER